jgi:hypothetical protein
MAITESPFAVLTAVVAPALLTNSSTVLVLGIGNRIARVIDRTRAVAEALAQVGEDSELHQLLQHQSCLLTLRKDHLSRALRLGYAAIGGFAAEALIAVLGGVLVHEEFLIVSRIAAIAALAIGFGSVGALVSACVYMVRETAVALDNLAEETQTVMLEAAQRNPRRG